MFFFVKTVDVNRLKICAPMKKPPKLMFFLEQQGALDNSSRLQVHIGHKAAPSTELTWNPRQYMLHKHQVNNVMEEVNFGSVHNVKVKKNDKICSPVIEMDDLLEPFRAHLGKDSIHLKRIAKDIDTFISDNIQSRDILLAWFVKENRHCDLKQEIIWVKLSNLLHRRGYFEEAKLLTWIIQKHHIGKEIHNISGKVVVDHSILGDFYSRNLIDHKTMQRITNPEETDKQLMVYVFVRDVIMENPFAFDMFMEYLHKTKQGNVSEEIMLKQQEPIKLHGHIFAKVISTNKDYLQQNMCTSVFNQLKTRGMISCKNMEILTLDIIVEDLQHSLTSANFKGLLQILQASGQSDIVTKLRDTYMSMGGREEFCSVTVNERTSADFCIPSPGMSSHTITTLEDMNKTQKMMKYVCQITFGEQQIKATGFVLDFARNRSNQKDYCFIVTCEHVLGQGLDKCLREDGENCNVIFNRHGENSVLPVKYTIKEIVFCEVEYDYVVLCLEYNQDLNTSFMKTGLRKYISALGDLKRLTLIGHADGNIMQSDYVTVVSKFHMHKEIAYSQARKDNIAANPNNLQVNPVKGNNLHFLDLARPEYFVFYECKSYHGSSGSPCFRYDNIKNTIELVCMHRAGIYSTNTDIQPGDPCDYGIGVLLQEVKADIENKLEQSVEWLSVP